MRGLGLGLGAEAGVLLHFTSTCLALPCLACYMQQSNQSPVIDTLSDRIGHNDTALLPVARFLNTPTNHIESKEARIAPSSQMRLDLI